MAANTGNIDLIQSRDLSRHPFCTHGPTLLFKRYDTGKGESRSFYACSAFRNKKDCDFFRWADEKYKEGRDNVKRDTLITHHLQRKRYHKFKKLPRCGRHVCCSCGLLMLPGDHVNHKPPDHVLRCRVGLKLLKRPSELFVPLENNKTFAQYLFSKKSVEFIMETLERLCFSSILCVGTPRIHEAVQQKSKAGQTSLKSFLLDLDERHGQLYPPSKYAKYNMFNNHFFEDSGQENAFNFLKDGKHNTVIITDPPFGGMVDALVASFLKLSSVLNNYKQQLCQDQENISTSERTPILWFFPYFMESRIVSQYPGMTMLDYKVDYDNHNLYKNEKKQKGSPVRIFTNIPPEKFVLPKDQGYWFCNDCKRYSSKENVHCDACRSCTSKDGTTYVHCDICMRCVKPSKVHCYTCMICDLKDHVCGRKAKTGCHICGNMDHKRRDCPTVHEKKVQRKGKRKRLRDKDDSHNKFLKTTS